MTQAALAENCDLSTNFIALLEGGRNTPSLETLEKLSKALGVPIGRLFDFHNSLVRGKDKEIDKIIRKLGMLKRKRDVEVVDEFVGLLMRKK